MPENPKQNEGIESGQDAGESEAKGRDQIRVRLLKNPKQNEGTESRRDVEEPETKGKDRI